MKSTKNSVENGLTGFLNFLSKTSTMQSRKNATPLPLHPRKGMSVRAAGKEFPAATYEHDLWLLSYDSDSVHHTCY